MSSEQTIREFLSVNSAEVLQLVDQLRKLLKKNLKDVIEQLDTPARMIAYCYGQRYTDMICVIFPSKKGVKLSFYKGNELPDPGKLLEGNAKSSRYVNIKAGEEIDPAGIKKLLSAALAAFKQRTSV